MANQDDDGGFAVVLMKLAWGAFALWIGYCVLTWDTSTSTGDPNQPDVDPICSYDAVAC